jgi:predicted nucleic acid-binding protein
MTTAIDTNVIVALWDAEETFHRAARTALDTAFNEATLVISGPVYAELLAAPRRTEEFIDQFCEEAGIAVEWELNERIWRAAGAAFQSYAERRKKQKGDPARRILAAFVIGAHALVRGYKLLTLDDGLYRAAFPRLAVMRI